MNAYQDYTAYRRRHGGRKEPRVRVSGNGAFKFNAAATRILHAEGVKAVVLLWHARRRSIAFRAAEEGDPEAFRLNLSGDGFNFSTKAFLSDVGWGLAGKSMTLSATWNAEEKVLELEPLP